MLRSLTFQTQLRHHVAPTFGTCQHPRQLILICIAVTWKESHAVELCQCVHSGRNVQDENDFDVGRVNVLSFRTQKSEMKRGVSVGA